jgi:hypothetical protein
MNIKKIYLKRIPCHYFLENSVSAYPIRIVSDTRIRIWAT